MSDHTQLRQQMRKRRLTLSPEQQASAAAGLLNTLANSVAFKNTRHIACYLANGGEIDPQPIIEKVWQQNRSCYLPVLDGEGDNKLYFAPYLRSSELVLNRYGIAEPQHEPDQLFPAEKLDLVLVPLVAIDTLGNRMGMGKGYYDRTFAFLQQYPRPQKPMLVGLAHSFQQVEKICANPWDVPLDAVANEQHFIRFR